MRCHHRWLLPLLVCIGLLLCAQFGASQEAGIDPGVSGSKAGGADVDWQQQAQQYKQELEQLRQTAANAQRQLEQQQQVSGKFEAEQAIADAVAQKEKELHSRLSALEQQVEMLQAMKQQQVQAALAEQEQALAASCDAKQAAVQKSLEALKADLAAAHKSSDSCKSSLQTFKQQHSHTGTPGFSFGHNLQDIAAWASAAVAQAREAAGPLLQAAEPYLAVARAKWEEGRAAVAPLLQKAQATLQDAISRMGLSDITTKASTTLTGLTATARSQLHRTERELKHIITSQLQSVPALKQYADPVIVQLLAYMVLGSPLLLLLPLLAALRGGKQAQDRPAAGRRRAKGDAARGDATPARAGRTAARTGPGAGSRATPGGRGGRGGREFRDGNESIYTP